MRKAIKQFFQNFKKDQRGLTLVELLAVVVILAIVGAIAFVVIGNVIDNSRKDAHISNAAQVINAAELAEASGAVFEIGDTISLTEEPLSVHIGELVDPWGSEGDYTFALSKTASGFKISSSHSNCSFRDATKSDLNSQGRELCTEGGSGGN